MNKKRRLLTKFLTRIVDTHLTSYAAHSAFYIIVSVIPFFFLIYYILRYFNMEIDSILNVLSYVLPRGISEALGGLLSEVEEKTNGTVYIITIIAVWWASGRGMLVVKNGINFIYNIKETRNYFLLRLIATGYTLLFAAGIIFTGLIFLFGAKIFQSVKASLPFLENLQFFGSFTKILVLLILLTVIFVLMYRFLPNLRMKVSHHLPGAVISAAGWIICTRIFSFYVRFSSNFAYIYGSLSTLVVAMLWLFVCMIIFFIGALINSMLFPADMYLDCEKIDIK